MSHVVHRILTSSTVLSNTATESTLFSFSLPANKLLTYKTVRGRYVLTLRQSSGADRTYTFRFKWGGTTSVDDAAIAVPTSAGITDLRTIMIDYEIGAQDSTSAQFLWMGLSISAIDANTSGLSGDFGTAPLLPQSIITANATATSTNANTIEVTAQSDASTSTQTMVMRMGYSELL